MAYLVMEYLPGITLRDLLQEYGALTPEQTIDIIDAVLSGLAAAHKAGIVHRDLKPENVLLADDGRIKIGDFGLARAASANTATGQALLGTIAYLSPELVTRGVADARSDIYARRHHDVRDAHRRAALRGRAADADRLPARQRLGADARASNDPGVPASSTSSCSGRPPATRRSARATRA